MLTIVQVAKSEKSRRKGHTTAVTKNIHVYEWEKVGNDLSNVLLCLSPVEIALQIHTAMIYCLYTIYHPLVGS